MKLLRFLCLFSVCLCSWGLSAVPAFAGEPVFAPNAKSVNQSSVYLTDTVLYTIKLDNTAGTADALDVVFTDHLPPGIEVQLFSLDGVPQALTLLSDGLPVGTIAAGTSRTVTILGVVTAIPRRPDPAQYDNRASWTYRYRPTTGAAKVNASFDTNMVSTPIVRLEPSMAIATVQLPPVLNLGTQINYTLTIANTGTLNSQGSTLTDAIPVGAIYKAGSTRLNGVAVADIALAGPYVLGGLINSPGEPPGQINAGEAATITFSVTSLTLPVVNLAVIDADGAGPIPPLNIVGTTQANPTTDLSITKSNGTTSVSAGSDTTYTLTVTNNGPTALSSVRVVDNLPLTLLNPIWTASAGTYNSSTGDWTGLSLGVGTSVTLTLKARVSPLAVGTLSNTATVSPPAGVTDSNAANNSATDSDSITLLADLGVAVTDSATSIAQGAPVSYVITVSNAGPGSLSSLTLTANPSPTLQNWVFTPDEGAYNSTTGAWTGLNLLPGQNVQITLAGLLPAAATGELKTTVSVSPPTGVTDPNAANNSATDSDSIVAAVSPLVLTQTVDKTAAKSGEIITYTITYRNSSAFPLPGVGIQNATPAFTTFVGASYAALPPSLASCTVTQPTVGQTGTIKWTFAGTLAPGGSGTVSFQVLVK